MKLNSMYLGTVGVFSFSLFLLFLIAASTFTTSCGNSPAAPVTVTQIVLAVPDLSPEN